MSDTPTKLTFLKPDANRFPDPSVFNNDREPNRFIRIPLAIYFFSVLLGTIVSMPIAYSYSWNVIHYSFVFWILNLLCVALNFFLILAFYRKLSKQLLMFIAFLSVMTFCHMTFVQFKILSDDSNSCVEVVVENVYRTKGTSIDVSAVNENRKIGLLNPRVFKQFDGSINVGEKYGMIVEKNLLGSIVTDLKRNCSLE